ncbi:sugar ABC transporter substrate-binding protein [Thermopolyspora sp. NPDC052614]|uniref:sugar ABC transporter substrate-binding protein n=1 Tax=Thermopolyspora sp. NPDC052614 TaxID=3155682 RepID=UPI00341FA4BD
MHVNHRPKRGGIVPLASVLVSAALALSACGGSNDSTSTSSSVSGGPIRVGLITKTETNPFFVKMKEGAQKAAEAKGVELMTAAGKFDGDNASQVTAIENMVAAGVKGILITPSDTKAIVPVIQRARDKGVLVIALDTPTDPQDGADALFATDNFQAGVLIGKYAAAAFAGRQAKIATLDLAPGITVGVLRHNGFLSGFGVPGIDQNAKQQLTDPRVVCSQDTAGDQAKGQTAMENCLQKDPGINLVYTINEPAALGAYTALKAAGKEKDVMIVSVDGGCTGVRAVQSGQIAATSQQYPLKMAEQGVNAVVEFAQNGTKASGYTDTGVTLIAAKPVDGVESKDVQFGLDNCWG